MKCSLLIVEDQDTLRRMYTRFLQSTGAEIREARDPDEALKLLGSTPIDVVLTDIQMPGSIDGVGLARRLRVERPGTDVIMMTGHPTIETAIETLREGVYDYLLKPFTPEQLSAVVGRCLEKRRLQNELDREKSLRLELEAAYAELKKLDRLREAFMARVNHELRTPLMVSMGLLGMLEGTNLDQAQTGLLSRAVKSFERLHHVVADLLTFSDLMKGDAMGPREAVDLVSMLRRTFEDYRPLFEKKEVSIELDLPEGLPKVDGDAGLLQVACKHLVANAALFNCLRGFARAKASAQDGRLLIMLENSGMELPQAEEERVFDSFYQIADSLTREVGGLGLGLAIVRRVAEAHGGSIHAKSRHGGGALFSLDLPAISASSSPGQ